MGASKERPRGTKRKEETTTRPDRLPSFLGFWGSGFGGDVVFDVQGRGDPGVQQSAALQQAWLQDGWVPDSSKRLDGGPKPCSKLFGLG